jgi:hypothetical protein
VKVRRRQTGIWVGAAGIVCYCIGVNIELLPLALLVWLLGSLVNEVATR